MKKTIDLNSIVRNNIRLLSPYSSARDEFKGEASLYLDANENNFGSPLAEAFNRYPDPLQRELKEAIASLKSVRSEQIFLGNGSDEAIDLLFRIFCRPGADKVITCPPTYGMYDVSARINDVEVIQIPLVKETFQLDTARILNAITPETKLIFFCCPNNPTGNGVSWSAIKSVLESSQGLVVVDEAYIDFASYGSLLSELDNYPNLVILQTFSKAWGLAGLRLGMAFASAGVIEWMNKVKAPYNINQATQALILQALSRSTQVKQWIRNTREEREWLRAQLTAFPWVRTVYPSEANFILMRVENAQALYVFLLSKGIVVRNRQHIPGCEQCLRISIGTPEENQKLIQILTSYNEKNTLY
ncbi:MAG: histidinol-phosphate transaminase [Bacteroidetes bacterium]|nr:histidinol-phosphate transaminase [Bacteroidota bacterium]